MKDVARSSPAFFADAAPNRKQNYILCAREVCVSCVNPPVFAVLLIYFIFPYNGTAHAYKQGCSFVFDFKLRRQSEAGASL
jgi:hypothetical protein